MIKNFIAALLQLAGFVLLVVAAWIVAPALGLAALGTGWLALGVLLERET